MSKRTAIRQIAEGDRASFVEAARASHGFHAPWVTAPCDDAQFTRHLNSFDGKTNFGFVAYLQSSGELVGAISLTNVVMGIFRSGYLGYFVFAGFERQGYMKVALKAVVRHAFSELKLHRVEANVQPCNKASIALVRSCGFSKEGYSPAYLKINGRWRDHERWALVRGHKNAA